MKKQLLKITLFFIMLYYILPANAQNGNNNIECSPDIDALISQLESARESDEASQLDTLQPVTIDMINTLENCQQGIILRYVDNDEQLLEVYSLPDNDSEVIRFLPHGSQFAILGIGMQALFLHANGANYPTKTAYRCHCHRWQ